ncbi:N-acetylglucosamine kinase [Aridibaculum aurantiacum]|uniref:N-acetylglucosamine kinase n=1 Tax=Aridibaculum aurantiacum TaxID=2810307 RepID=UPI001A977534|nr:N-acetylglucosamine kinase [Aridibaculum aurantiacum]
MSVQLIADSGSTNCEWVLLKNGRRKNILTSGISPYFMTGDQVVQLLHDQLMPKLKVQVDQVHFYGTGLGNPGNEALVKLALKQVLKGAKINIHTDLLAAARALCGTSKGIACILGTGSNSCFYNGKKIVKNSPGLGFILGDEGSGAYLGKKVVQYYLYNTFDEDLRARFDARFETNGKEILESVYRKPLPNRYLAGFTKFLAENRGHYMVENIIEDGLNDFFFNHLYKYRESWTHPIHFIGSVAFGFKDVLQELCNSYELELGKVLQTPLDGLVAFHKNA